MTIFWMLCMISFIPIVSCIVRGAPVRHRIDIMLIVLIYICGVTHLGFLYAKTYTDIAIPMWFLVVHCLSICTIVPLTYFAICRRLGILPIHEMVMLLLLAASSIVTKANVQLGLDDAPLNVPANLFDINFCYGGEIVWTLHNYELVMALQGVFLMYKIALFLDMIRKRHYHFSKAFTRLLCTMIATIVIIIASMLPSDNFWRIGYNMMIFIAVIMSLLAIMAVMLRNGYDVPLVVDVNEEPVILGSSHQFAEMAEKFKVLVQEEEDILLHNGKMDDVAQRLGTNRTYLAQMMKEEFGTTFAAYMNNLRVQKAMRIMMENGYKAKVQDVAWQSGFSSLSSFNKVFKAATGVVPSEWRKE